MNLFNTLRLMVHWPVLDGLLHLVHQEGRWAGGTKVAKFFTSPGQQPARHFKIWITLLSRFFRIFVISCYLLCYLVCVYSFIVTLWKTSTVVASRNFHSERAIALGS